ncbi:MAG TPA: hypothetical protein VGL15_11205 [Vicinamibacteria bacterium]|jgi:hypothetical protein
MTIIRIITPPIRPGAITSVPPTNADTGRGPGPSLPTELAPTTAAPPRSKTALRLIKEWTVLHRADLEANWARMKAGHALERVAPLE